FIAANRLSIIRGQVWGAPDLVAEVLSPGTRAHDRGEKLQWYRQYGVRECWLVDAAAETVTIVDFTGGEPVERAAHGIASLRSSVLPALHASAFGLFA
ncbi:MAG: Uma2 family endonuclease, partial [Acidobacteria bacterium]|nr:Uma2 family endonuclease [Acidobacteriota bacterium]